MSLQVDVARPIMTAETQKSQVTNNKKKQEPVVAQQSPKVQSNADKQQELIIELTILDAYIKEYENSSGLEGITKRIGHKIIGWFGGDNIDTWRTRKAECEKELNKLGIN